MVALVAALEAEFFTGNSLLLSGFSGLDMVLVASSNMAEISHSHQYISCTVSIVTSYFTTMPVEYGQIYI